jgi:vancomycin permeability regulator SanA
VAERAGALRWTLRIAGLVVLALLVYLSVTFVQVLSASGEDDHSGSEAIIVLGAAQYDGVPSPALQARLDHAHELYDAGVAPRIVLTGANQPGDRFTEAYAGFTYLAGEGIPQDDLTIVDDGESTWESLAAAKRVLADEGVGQVTLVSDGYHNRRLAGISDELGIEVALSPTGSDPSPAQLLRETVLVSLGQVIGYGRMLRFSS